MVAVTDVRPRPKVVIIKATVGNRTRRFALEGHAARLDKVTGMIRDRFELASPAAHDLYYRNGRGEMVHVDSEIEFADALQVGGRELALIVDHVGRAMPCGGFYTKLQEARQATDELERLVDRLHDITRRERDNLGPRPAMGSRSPITLSSPESPGFETLDFQLPQWVAREVLHYETIPAEPRGALSDLEDREAETDLLASPHPAVGLEDDDSERPILPKAPMQISLHSAFISAVADYSLSPFAKSDLERAFQPYKDETMQISLHSAFVSAMKERERRASGADRPGRAAEVRERFVERTSGPYENEEKSNGQLASAGRKLRASVPPKVKFQIPFPAFVPFPPSPTRSTPVFSLSESTPFPFRVTAATSTTCTCRCSCGDRDAATETRATPPSVTVGVQTEFESPRKLFNFSVSVGTQHRAPAVSAGTQSDSNPTSVEAVSVGTQSKLVPEEDDRDAEYELI